MSLEGFRNTLLVNGLLVFFDLLLLVHATTHAFANDLNRDVLSAAGKGELDEVRGLLEKGADINARDEHGKTPLMMAIANFRSEVAMLLLVKGADASLKTKAGFQATDTAIATDSPKLVELLVRKGFSDDPSSWLPWASYRGYVSLVTALLEQGADPNVKDKNAVTPLMVAAKSGALEAMRKLMAKGASINAVNSDGWTPLVYAILNDQADAARLLLESGADVNVRTRSGKTALYWATEMGNGSLAELLKTRGAE